MLFVATLFHKELHDLLGRRIAIDSDVVSERLMGAVLRFIDLSLLAVLLQLR
jgi:hypothetical protein